MTGELNRQNWKPDDHITPHTWSVCRNAENNEHGFVHFSSMTLNFLDNACTKIQNMACKTSKIDLIALEYWYYGFLGRLRVDGRGFLHQKPILKNVRQNRNQDAAHAQKRVTFPLTEQIQRLTCSVVEQSWVSSAMMLQYFAMDFKIFSRIASSHIKTISFWICRRVYFAFPGACSMCSFRVTIKFGLPFQKESNITILQVLTFVPVSS